MLDLRRWDAAWWRRAASTRSMGSPRTWAASASSSSHKAEIMPRQRADQPAHAGGGARERRAAVSVHVVGLRLPAVSARTRPDVTPLREERRLSRPTPRTATAGRSSSPSGSAGTTARTTASRPASCASTTSSARSAPSTAGARSRPRPSAARSRWPRTDDEIEVWGDGKQTRSYCYIDDCVEGIHRLMRSGFASR